MSEGVAGTVGDHAYVGPRLSPVLERTSPVVSDVEPSPAGVDQTWCDTWYVNAFDLDRELFVVAHFSWSPDGGHGRANIGLSSAVRATCLYVDTEVPLASPIASLTVDPWSSVALQSRELDIDIRFDQVGPAVEVVGAQRYGSVPQTHHEAWGVVSGTVAGRAFRGVGGRDRSSGPRDLPRHKGRHSWIHVAGEDGTALVLCRGNTVHAAISSPPDVSFGYVRTAGVGREVPSWTTYRSADGAVVEIDVDGRLLTVENTLPPVRLAMDRHSSPERTSGPIYRLVQHPVVLRSPWGRLAGVVEEGHLVVC